MHITLTSNVIIKYNIMYQKVNVSNPKKLVLAELGLRVLTLWLGLMGI